MVPLIIDSLYRMKKQFLNNTSITASRINSRNASIFWESERNFDFIYTFLKRKREVEGEDHPDLLKWIYLFEQDRGDAALNFWYEVHKGIHESLREF